MPVGDILVCDTRGNIEHDDTALAVDVVTITETTELLLTSGVPDIEGDLTEVLPTVSAWARRWWWREQARDRAEFGADVPWRSPAGEPRHRGWPCTSSRTRQSSGASRKWSMIFVSSVCTRQSVR